MGRTARRTLAARGSNAMVLVGALAYSGRFRAVIAEQTDQPHTLAAITGVLGRLGRHDPAVAV
ncbi:MAG TPA: hypothetical protein VMM13_05625 [Euzebya sp.]|nr:hypothetical protein [Euzebya sp.]